MKVAPACRLFGHCRQAYYQSKADIGSHVKNERLMLDTVREIRGEDPGIGGYKLWIMLTAGKRYIGNIANPQLIGRGWDKALYQVLPLMVTMVGIGCAPGFAGRKHQAVSTKQRVEAVATGHEPLPAKPGAQPIPTIVTISGRDRKSVV